MKILIVDRDELNVSMLSSKIEAEGYEVAHEPSKNEALDRIINESFDAVIIDPAPLTSPKPVMLNIRRNIKYYPYIFLMSETASQEEALKSGSNDLLAKPIDAGQLKDKLKNAEILTDLVRRIGDDAEDFPSAGGVIAKSAFNQLFLSALDRADRYGEIASLLIISISNHEDMIFQGDAQGAAYASAKLSQHLVRLRRQSDVIGQTGKGEYILLMQRPAYESEPQEAAARFAEELGKCDDLKSGGSITPQLSVQLIAIPTGELIARHDIKL